MIAYEDLELPALPEPWYWEKGNDDGDPCAVRRELGWYTRVHEAQACSYTEDLAVTTRPDHRYDGEHPRKTHGVPFSVYAAVAQALVQWYEVKPESQGPGMRCWGLKGRELVTEYDAKQVEYWLRGFVDKAPPPKNKFDRELTMFLAAAAADETETRAMGIAWGREVVRKQEPIWHAGVQTDGTVCATNSDAVIEPHRATAASIAGCPLRFDCKLPRSHKGPCRSS